MDVFLGGAIVNYYHSVREDEISIYFYVNSRSRNRTHFMHDCTELLKHTHSKTD